MEYQFHLFWVFVESCLLWVVFLLYLVPVPVPVPVLVLVTMLASSDIV
jgi:hypothetical protein